MQRMRHLPILAALVTMACWPLASARAEAVDLTGAACADFMGMGDTDRAQIAIWMAGYYAGLAQRPQIDVSKVLAAPAAIATVCEKTPQGPLIGPDTRAIFFPPAN